MVGVYKGYLTRDAYVVLIMDNDSGGMRSMDVFYTEAEANAQIKGIIENTERMVSEGKPIIDFEIIKSDAEYSRKYDVLVTDVSDMIHKYGKVVYKHEA